MIHLQPAPSPAVARASTAGCPVAVTSLGPVRLTEFWTRMERRFGEGYARSYAADQVLPQLGSRTVQQALDQGENPKDVWRAVSDAAQQPSH